LWWSGATNLGVTWALFHQATHVLTLNNDTIAAGDFIEKMLFWAEQSPSALLGAFAVDAETMEPVYGGEIINWKTGGFTSLLKIIKIEDQHGLKQVTHFPGRGLLIPSEVFTRIGLFDNKHFPHYAADYDFTHRATRADYPIYCNYDARLLIYPDASGSVQLTKKKNFINYFNHLFGIKGAANLKVFTLYAVRNCPGKYLLWFLIRGYTQRILGYWVHQLGLQLFPGKGGRISSIMLITQKIKH
jgi:GT2 family glycosyltransferase